MTYCPWQFMVSLSERSHVAVTALQYSEDAEINIAYEFCLKTTTGGILIAIYSNKRSWVKLLPIPNHFRLKKLVLYWVVPLKLHSVSLASSQGYLRPFCCGFLKAYELLICGLGLEKFTNSSYFLCRALSFSFIWLNSNVKRIVIVCLTSGFICVNDTSEITLG